MLKVKYINNPTSLRKYITPTILFIFIFLYFGVFFYNLYLQNLLQTKSFYPEDIVNMVFYIDDLENIDAVGQTLYNFSMVCFLIAGLTLLVSLIGVIIITLNFSVIKKSQHADKQNSRNSNNLRFFKHGIQKKK
jgi:NADH:ubiquinone oxidoreductase subunit 6 (subunit J)